MKEYGMADNGEFKFPEARLGDQIVAFATPHTTEGLTAWVTKVEPGSINCIAFRTGDRGGVLQFVDMLHADDPRVEGNKELWEDGDRGIFRLSQSEIERRQMVEQHAAMKHLIETLQDKVAELDKRVKSLASSK